VAVSSTTAAGVPPLSRRNCGSVVRRPPSRQRRRACKTVTGHTILHGQLDSRAVPRPSANSRAIMMAIRIPSGRPAGRADGPANLAARTEPSGLYRGQIHGHKRTEPRSGDTAATAAQKLAGRPAVRAYGPLQGTLLRRASTRPSPTPHRPFQCLCTAPLPR
jgi:hypothetical protein